MQGLDTNVVVRILLNDNDEQSKIVYELCLKALLEKKRYFVSLLVILELEWILSKVYKFNRNDVIIMIEQLLSYHYLMIEKNHIVKNTLDYAKNNTFDLSDLLIGAIAQANDCQSTLTFDKKASKSNFFALLT